MTQPPQRDQGVSRLLRLLLLLLDRQHQVTRRVIVDRIPDFGPVDDRAAQKRLERAFDQLRALGWSVAVTGADEDDRAAAAHGDVYDPSYSLEVSPFVPSTLPPDAVPAVIELTRQALAQAEGDIPAGAVSAMRAKQSHRQLRITVDDRTRLIDPYLVTMRTNNRWYVVGRSVAEDWVGTFRLDGDTTVEALDSTIASPVPDDLDRFLNPLTWGSGSDEFVAHVVIDSQATPQARSRLGSALITIDGDEDRDATVALAIRCSEVDELAAVLVELRDRVRHVEPARIRRAVIARLGLIAPTAPPVNGNPPRRDRSREPASASSFPPALDAPLVPVPPRTKGSSGADLQGGALLLALAHLDRVGQATGADVAAAAGVKLPHLGALLQRYLAAWELVFARSGGRNEPLTITWDPEDPTIPVTIAQRSALTEVGRRQVDWPVVLNAARLAAVNLAALQDSEDPTAEESARRRGYQRLIDEVEGALGIAVATGPEAIARHQSADAAASLREIPFATHDLIIDYDSPWSLTSRARRVLPVALQRLRGQEVLLAVDVNDHSEPLTDTVKVFYLSLLTVVSAVPVDVGTGGHQRARTEWLSIWERQLGEAVRSSAFVSLPNDHWACESLERDWGARLHHQDQTRTEYLLKVDYPVSERLFALLWRWPEARVRLHAASGDPDRVQSRAHRDAQALIKHYRSMP